MSAPRDPLPGTPEAGEFVRVGPLCRIVSELESLGVDPVPVFQGVGLEADKFRDPDYTTSFSVVGRLLASCAEAAECPHFGLHMGQSYSLSQIGLPGFLLKTATTLGDALHDAARFLHLNDRGGSLIFNDHDTQARIGYQIQLQGVQGSEQIFDMTLSFICNVLRQLCGPRWNPTEVWISRRAPEDTRPYLRHFRAPLRFDAEESVLCFDSSWLDWRLTTADPALHEYLERDAKSATADPTLGFMGEFRTALHDGIKSDECTLDATARRLGLHPRALSRKLAAQDTNFRKELEAMRAELCRQLLGSTRLGIEQIALALGYSGASALDHAFHRWHGTSPAQWRHQNADVR